MNVYDDDSDWALRLNDVWYLQNSTHIESVFYDIRNHVESVFGCDAGCMMNIYVFARHYKSKQMLKINFY
jgi:hypothetical protein